MKAAIYCRLSVEDEDKGFNQARSESILNQELLLSDYAKEHHFDLFAVYVDEDYSGLDRNRPAFKRMLADAKNGLFDIILCKTQSRFTRDMELVERYLHNLFPLWGIRFIGVIDGVDTAEPKNKKSRQINALINEWYCEDLSDNIRTVLRKKMEAGQFIGSFACFGYAKSTTDHHKLIIDDEACEVVRYIYESYLKGKGIRQISNELTQKNIDTPSNHKQKKGLKFKPPHVNQETLDKNIWSYNTIKRILKNPTYTGSLVQGVERKISYKHKKMVHMPSREWVVVQNSHPAIITDEDFLKVQERFKARRKRP